MQGFVPEAERDRFVFTFPKCELSQYSMCCHFNQSLHLWLAVRAYKTTQTQYIKKLTLIFFFCFSAFDGIKNTDAQRV